MKCESCNQLKNPETKVLETNFWLAKIDKNQSELGRTLLILKRHCPSLIMLTEEENKDFLEAIKNLEPALKKAFGCEMVNVSCLMNHAYKNSPPNPHIHWHIRPRYKEKVEFEGISFEDSKFGSHYDPKAKRVLDLPMLKKVAKRVLEKL